MSSTISAELIRELLKQNRDEIISAMTEMMKSSPSASAAITEAVSKKSRKSKAKSETDDSSSTKEKTKRPANNWVQFTMRIESLIRKHEEDTTVSAADKMKTTIVKQFCSHLKEQKGYDGWTDSGVIEELATWTPPDVSKMSVASKSKKESDAASVASAAPEPTTEPKPKKAAKKAADTEAEPKPKKAAKKAAAAPEPVAPEPMVFREWMHEGSDYWKNQRGDVLTAEMEWVGRWDGIKIDEAFPQPDDLESGTFAESE